MKPFRLFFGAIGQLGTHDVTGDLRYKLVVEAVLQFRHCLLNDNVLRQPFLHLFTTVYKDKFPADLASCAPAANWVSNESKITEIQAQSPTDDDVIDFLTNSFPDLYLTPGELSPGGVNWGKTWTGWGEADKERISINVQLVQIWLQSVSNDDQVSLPKLWFMFIAVFLHEIAHSSLVWYGKRACGSPQLGGVDREAGDYMEKAFFSGISGGEFDMETMCLLDIGLLDGGVFYPIDGGLATDLATLDTSHGLPFTKLSALSPAPPTLGHMHAKFSQAVSSIIQHQAPAPRPLAGTN